MSDEKGNRVDNLKLKIDEEGNIIGAKDNGWDLEYGEEEIKEGKTMVGATIVRNPCRWRKIGGKWRCI